MELSWQEKNGLLLVIPATEQLRRGQFYYGKWYTVLSKQLLYFVDPAKWTAQHMVLVDSKEKCWELMSALLDLRCFGDVMDKVGTPDKTTLFDNLRTTYQDLGQRLGWMINMDEHLAEARVNWDTAGHFLVEQDGPTTKITCKILRSFVTLGPEHVGSDPGPFTVKHNFSVHLACLVSARDSYLLVYIFPQLGRSLRRRVSEETGAAAAVPGLASASSEAAAGDQGLLDMQAGSSSGPAPALRGMRASRAASEPVVVVDAGLLEVAEEMALLGNADDDEDEAEVPNPVADSGSR